MNKLLFLNFFGQYINMQDNRVDQQVNPNQDHQLASIIINSISAKVIYEPFVLQNIKYNNVQAEQVDLQVRRTADNHLADKIVDNIPARVIHQLINSEHLCLTY